MESILVVDDEEQVRRLLYQTLSEHGYGCTLAASVAEARKCLEQRTFELVISDVAMPGESGIELIKHIKANYIDTAVIMVTAVDDPKTSDAAIESGTAGYILKPFHPNELLINARNALRQRKLEIANRVYQHDLELMLQERTAKLRRALEGIIQSMSRTVEARDPYTAGHQQRVADLALALAMEMRVPKDQREGIRMAGMIHDMGKISVPAEILSKPTKLLEIESALIRTHPARGYDIIADIEFPWPIAQIILQHHEKINGTGYPQGLSGDQILLEARILCVADVVEAMASHRPYRPALGMDKALDEIRKNKGILYDSEVVAALVRLGTAKIEEILGQRSSHHTTE